MNRYSVIFESENREVRICAGFTILEAAEEAGVILNTACGGEGTCGKCVVKILPDGEDVLACKYSIHKDITVVTPIELRYFENRKIESHADIDIHTCPSISKLYLPGSKFNTDVIIAALKEELGECKIDVQVESLEIAAVKTVDGVTVVFKTFLDGEGGSKKLVEVVSVEAGDTTGELFGVAVDIGSTTVVAKLFDLNDGRCIGAAATANPQISRGDDVIGRIKYASNEKGLSDLHRVIVSCINSLIDEICNKSSVELSGIYEVCVAGNTTMGHIFLKYPVKQLGQAPYAAYSVEAADINAGELGLKINSCGNVHTIENIAGFVGSDTTAAALAVGMNETEKTSLLIDIGTNGELVLAAGGRLVAASCAAGPALEGARISQGSRAVEGAIEGVVISSDDIDLEVIGGGVGRSICGSGLIDAMAVVLDLGVVDETGRFVDKEDLSDKVSEKILARMTTVNSQPAFILSNNADNEYDDVLLTQKDVRETQLAKAAIRAGTIVLQKKVGVEDSQIEEVLLAGAFGNYINRESALRIGLLPPVPIEKVHFVGNAACSGCQMILLNNEYRKYAAELSKKIEYIEIANETEFQIVFADALMFGKIS